MELASRRHQFVPRSGPDPLAATRSQSDCPVAGVQSGTPGDAGRGTRPLQPHQPCVPASEGVPQRHSFVGQDERRGAGVEAGCLFLAGVRRPRVGADLFRRPGRPLWRPHQKRKRVGRAVGRHRLVLRPGLFQAAPGYQRLAARGVSRHQGRESSFGAGPRARRPIGHDRDQHPHRQAAGQGPPHARGTGESAADGQRCGRQQPRGSRADFPPLRRRQSHANPAGAGCGRRRRAGASGAGDYAGRLSLERRA